jgi:hypothetical protein
VRVCLDRSHADGRLHLLLPVRRLRHHPAAETGWLRHALLLRVLLLWLRAVSIGPNRRGVLSGGKRGMSGERAKAGATSAPPRDWTGGARGLLTWCLPIALLLLSPLLGGRYLVFVWPTALTFMGVACLLNARRCRRVHCYATGPFFLVLAGVALLYGLGVLPLGANGWGRLSAILVVGSLLLTCGSEWLLGRYLPPRH